MPPATVSVITATELHPDRVGYLLELHSDLDASAVPWQWVVCVDGDHDRDLPEALSADPRVQVIRAGRAIGAAAARNLALHYAQGAWVACVDDDDRLPAGSLHTRLAAAQAAPVGWVGGLLADLRAGELSVWDCPAPRGRVAAGELWQSWGAPERVFPIGPTTLLIRADLLRSVGGWQGLPQAEDFGMVMAVTSLWDGIVVDEVVYHYRKHPGQMMAGTDFHDLESTVRAIAYERGRLLVDTLPPS